MASLQGRFLKEVTMYHFDAPGETPPLGWAVCDGTTYGIGQHDIGGGVASYTVPDLRNRFVLGADPTKAAGDAGTTGTAPTNAPGPKGVGGQHAKTLATAELPSHTHNFTTGSAGSHSHTGSAASGGSHSHTGSTNSTGSHSHGGGNHRHDYADQGNGSVQSGSTAIYNATALNTITNQTAYSGAIIPADGTHAHTVTIDAGGTHSHTVTIDAGGSHSHTGTTDATGSGTAFDTRPRFYGLVFIIKIRS
jgi:hypothetical protein